VFNGVGMGLASTFVLVCSNLVISLLRKVIPSRMRIPCFIVVIATFVTIVDLLMQAFLPALSKSLGLFIPLIVVNCMILGRAEAFASKNGPFISIIDGLGMGIGFTLALGSLGVIREILGNGTLMAGTPLEFPVPPFNAAPWIIMILPPGAFIGLGFLIAAMNAITMAQNRKRREAKLAALAAAREDA
jgi:electron transport complex protein RnfE